MFAHAGFVYLVRESAFWGGADEQTISIDVVDVNDPTAPTYVETMV